MSMHWLSSLLAWLAMIALTTILLRHFWKRRNEIRSARHDEDIGSNDRTNVLSGYSDWPIPGWDLVTSNLSVVTVLASATRAMDPILDAVLPPLTLLTTLASISNKLDAAAYTHWITRIMDLPHTPEQFSPEIFDSNSAISIISHVPTLLKALRPQLAAGNRELALDVVQLALAGEGAEALLTKYPEVFAGFAEPSIESIVRDVHRAALDYVLASELPPNVAQNVGGLDALLRAVDKVRANPEASAALDMVMTTAKTLESVQKHPETEFNDAAVFLSRSNLPAAA